MIRLAIAEDHTIVRWALREALSKADDIEVVGEAGTAAETLDMVKRERPDVLILDISLPDRSGFDVLKRNTSKQDTGVSLRDSLQVFMGQGATCADSVLDLDGTPVTQRYGPIPCLDLNTEIHDGRIRPVFQ